MSTVTFTATFNNGVGTVAILINGVTLHLNPGHLHDFTDLPPGQYTYVISGAAAPAGTVIVAITGPIIADPPKTYGPGIILPELNTIQVF